MAGRILKNTVLILALSGAVLVAAYAKGEDVGLIPELKLFSKAINVINEAYVGDVTPRALLYEGIRGMLVSLDKYCLFIDPKLYQLLKIHMKGEYAGVGIVLQKMDHYPGVRDIKPGSAAAKAGVAPQDKILKIDGISMENKELFEVAELLRGEAEKPVRLTLWRPVNAQTFDLEIKREKIQIDTVLDARMVTKRIGYFRISNFSENTATQADSAIRQLASKGMGALIIDLRNDDGGLLPQAVAMAERFLPEGKKIVSVKSKIAEQRKEYFSSGKNKLPEYRLVILVNHKTASASEIFTAAMQDYKRATVIGTQTYGKASVQSVIPLDEESAMKLTTARYQSALGRGIDGVGLWPDEIVDPSPEGGPDLPLLKALEVLKDFQ